MDGENTLAVITAPTAKAATSENHDGTLSEECSHLSGRLREICMGVSGLSREIENKYRATERFGNLGPIPVPIFDKSTARSQAPPQKPLTLLERAASFTKTVAGTTVNGFHPLSDHQIQERLAICQSCEFLKNDHCTLCGCSCGGGQNYLNKLAHPQQECPHKPPKWLAVNHGE